MSLLSEFFFATPADVQAVDICESPAGRFPGLRAARTDVVKLVQLQCLVDGSRFEDHVRSLDSLFVRSQSDDGPWVVRVPDSLAEFLATAEADKVRMVGTQWAQTEEWRRDGGTPDNIVPFLGQMCQLARMAKSASKDLYVWICL